MNRWQLAFCGLLGLLALTGLRLAGSDVQLDTRLADLAPPVQRDARARTLLESADAFAASSVRFLIVPQDPDAPEAVRAVDAAATTLIRELDGIADLRRLDPAAREAQLLDALAPRRFSLLSPTVAAAVDEQATDRLVDDALEALYSPGLSVSALSFDDDPLGLFGDWLATRSLAATADDASDAASLGRIIDAQQDPAAADAPLADAIERARAATLDAHPSVLVHRTGVLLFSREAGAASRADIDRISIGSLLGLAVLLLPVFRSAWPLLLPGASIVVGAATGAALVFTVYGSVHVLTLVFGASLIGIVIDYSVHGFAHASTAPADARTNRLAPPLQRALLLSLATSAVGYAALGASTVDALARVAVFSVGGLFGAWLTVVALLPWMSARGTRFVPGALQLPVRALSGLGGRVAGALQPGGARLTLLAIACVAIGIGLWRSDSDDDPRRLIDLSPELIADAGAIGEHATDDPDVARRLLVTANTNESLWSALAGLRDTAPGDVRFTSLIDVLPSPAEQAIHRQRSALLLADGGAVEQVLELAGHPDPTQQLERLRKVLEQDGRAPLSAEALLAEPALGLPPLVRSSAEGVAALVLVSRDADPDGLRQAIGAAQLPADARVELIDAVADTAAQLGAQRRAALSLLVLAVIAVAVLLLIVYRQVAVLALVAVPATAIAATLLTLSLLGIPLTLFHAVGLFLVLGLGMDYTIFLSELGRPGAATRDSDAGSTLPAIVLSAATSLLSFGLLSASSLPVARFFGQTVLIGNTVNLVLTFVLLHVLMHRTSEVLPRKATSRR